ncbi:hypothetical protein [Arcobacter sp. LA11]|uniref:hypothetical protein n=1 Tax=Arcobacter sp. LA11 TaxID=1898176 RepID=UPI0009353BD5|nr:hypothetical protein [Arcobacter sp. LA11]
MKKLFFYFIISVFISVSVNAKYITPLNGPGVEITRYFAHKNGGVSLYISGPVLNSDGCTSAFRVYIPNDLPGKDILISSALMAFSSGKKIGIHGSGCSTTNFWGGAVDVPIVDNLWVFP